MKTNSLVLFAFLLISTASFANRRVFNQISNEAQVGNGSTRVASYDKNLDKKELVAFELKELKKEYRKNCGPWKNYSTRRTAIKKIDSLESGGDSTTVVEKLEKLYEDDKILAIVGAESNNEIQCSLSYFNIYGTDGSVLELRYDLGD